jgi:hypothetical protein
VRSGITDEESVFYLPEDDAVIVVDFSFEIIVFFVCALKSFDGVWAIICAVLG